MVFHNGHLVEIYLVPHDQKIGNRIGTFFVKSERTGIEEKLKKLLEDPTPHHFYRFEIKETKYIYEDEDCSVYSLDNIVIPTEMSISNSLTKAPKKN